MINDFQRGRLPHYVAPPELKEDEPVAVIDGIRAITQDLDDIGKAKFERIEGQEGICDEASAQLLEENEGSDSEADEPTPIIAGGADWGDEN